MQITPPSKTFTAHLGFISMKYILLTLLFTVSSVISNAEKPSYKSATLLTDFSYTYENHPRTVPVKIYYPQDARVKNAPVIMMSHGLGGSRDIGTYLGNVWSENGFVVVAMQHEGSDKEVLKGKERAEYMKALKKAISVESYLKRVQDVKASIDQITKWNGDQTHQLFGKLNLDQIGMCGHSFGAVTTQAVSGQSNPLTGNQFTDKRIKAAFAMSPSIPGNKGKPDAEANKNAFSNVSIPWLLMTGTEDKSIVTPNVTAESRKLVYQNLPAGDKYQLVLKDATHMAFSDRTIVGTKHRNPNHHTAIIAISTAFFQAYLYNDATAKTWLKSDPVKEILSPDDSWEKK
jgi:predicted dienelactone hydrolase